MTKKYLPISPDIAHFLHGADYNPEQWLSHPEFLEEDIRLMKLANCNVMSIGIFSWAMIEREEGLFTFDWLDQILASFADNGIYAFLATPSGARPTWLAQKYPEVLRVEANRVRNLFGGRHNHCFTSPIYREKVAILNRKLAERYSAHSAVIGWHISNEYGGECHCNLCQEAFRGWLKNKYGSLDELNQQWWSTFWSHNLTDWSQIQSPAPHGETAVHAMNLDWKRFVTDQTVDFCRHEIEPLRKINPNLPVTTNFMETYEGLNYWKFKDVLDVISWDAYPKWHEAPNDEKSQAVLFSFNHDIFRSIKGGKPFMLMESTPSMTNWQPVSKLKKPGIHQLASLQAVAHGSDTIQYFQWRQSRGSSEKFHGAVVSHSGHENTRTFQDVKDLGEKLGKMSEVIGTSVQPEVAVIFDWENRWAIKDSQGPRNKGINYEKTVIEHYRALWELGVPVDVIDMDTDLSKYKLVIAPMLYMVKAGIGEKIESFVKSGGIFISTYWSGIVNENDLCFLGGFPGPLRKTLGIWSEEIDALHDWEINQIITLEENSLKLEGVYEAHELCDLIHLEGAEVLASYKDDFYQGRPALTVNRFGTGKAYYIASRNKGSFHKDFYTKVVEREGITRIIDTLLPEGVTVQLRTDEIDDYIFLLNFSREDKTIDVSGKDYTDILNDIQYKDLINLPPYGSMVLKRKACYRTSEVNRKNSSSHTM